MVVGFGLRILLSLFLSYEAMLNVGDHHTHKENKLNALSFFIKIRLHSFLMSTF